MALSGPMPAVAMKINAGAAFIVRAGERVGDGVLIQSELRLWR